MIRPLLALTLALPAAAQVKGAVSHPGLPMVSGYAAARARDLSRLTPLQSLSSAARLKGFELAPAADLPPSSAIQNANASFGLVRMYLAESDWWNEKPERKDELERKIGSEAMRLLETEAARLDEAAKTDPAVARAIAALKAAHERFQREDAEKELAALFDGVQLKIAEAREELDLAGEALEMPPASAPRGPVATMARDALPAMPSDAAGRGMWQLFMSKLEPAGDRYVIERTEIPMPPAPPNIVKRGWGSIGVETKASKAARADVRSAAATWDRFMAVLSKED